MLGTLPKTSQGYFICGNIPKVQFPKRQLLKFFLSFSANQTDLVTALSYLVRSSHSTQLPSQIQSQRSAPLPNLAERFQPHCSLRCFQGPNNIWEVSAWDIKHLESCHLGNFHLDSHLWENAFGEIPNKLHITGIQKHILNYFKLTFPSFRLWQFLHVLNQFKLTKTYFAKSFNLPELCGPPY